MTEFAASRQKAYSYLDDNDNICKKVKGKKCVIERILKFYHYKDHIISKKPILQLKQRFKSEAQNVYTEKINKIVLSSDDDNWWSWTQKIVKLLNLMF